MLTTNRNIACENSRFSSLLDNGDVWRGGATFLLAKRPLVAVSEEKNLPFAG